MIQDEKKTYDVFISHASEDKAEVARPLADYLMRSGVKVWLDSFELKIGDSLRESIDHGLSQSRFGIVILSPSFFIKNWPKRELNGLFAIEEGTKKVILPVWHNVSKSEVSEYSPILADRLAGNTAMGLLTLAKEIATVVRKDGSITATLAHLIDSGPEPSEIGTFLEFWPSILAACIGQFGVENYPAVRSDVKLEQFDLLFQVRQSTSGQMDWCCISFLPSVNNPQTDAKLDEFLSQREFLIADNHFKHLLRQVFPSLRLLPYLYDRFSAAVFYGRRDAMSETAKAIIRKHSHIRVHSYDRLLEASVKLATLRKQFSSE